MPPAAPDDCAAHRAAGVDLFNAGHYWHAHEEWEICWRAAHQPDTLFYQGLIQAAAALVHWQRGNPRGLRQNWAKGRPKLVALPPTMYGLDLAALIAAMDRLVLSSDPAAASPPHLITHNS